MLYVWVNLNRIKNYIYSHFFKIQRFSANVTTRESEKVRKTCEYSEWRKQ